MVHVSQVHKILSQYMLSDVLDFVYDFEKSIGSTLVDQRTGKSYLDLFGFFASLPLGHRPKCLETEDFKSEMARVSRLRPSISDIATVEYADFVQAFASEAEVQNFSKFFFIDGGALAVENALKTAFDWKVRKNLEKSRNEKGSQIIHFEKAFHGRSGYTLSMTNTFDPLKTMYFPKFKWPRVVSPVLQFPLDRKHLEAVEALEVKAISEIKRAFQSFGDDIAAICIEPIQGEGGDNHFRKEFLQALRTIADENEALLIFDEIQCGFGITGKMWAHQYMNVIPDILVFGKKAQICGIAITERINEVDSVFKVKSRINSTFGGNLPDMVRCKYYLKGYKEEHALETATQTGAFILKELQDFQTETGKINNSRGRGLMIAFDVPSTQKRDQLQKALFANGVIVLGCGERSIRFRPALNISMDDVKSALKIIFRVIETT